MAVVILDGDGDAAKIYGLKRDTPGKAYRQEDLELWWPLDGNYSDMSGNGRNATATVNPRIEVPITPAFIICFITYPYFENIKTYKT